MKSLFVVVLLLCLFSVAVANDEISATDLVKQNLQSIGTDQARAAIKSRAVEGTLKFSLLNRSGGDQEGKEVLISEENKSVALLKLPNSGYHGERFVCDGKKIEVANIQPGVFSNLGAFINVHPEILTEGLFGGTLSTGWALSRLEESHAKLQDQGVKKINGKELRRVQYSPAKHSDLEIYLFFDPKTTRHVMTTYSLSVSPKMGSTLSSNSKQDFTRYYLEERFDDFKDADGLQLPNHWTIQFTSDIAADPDHPDLRWENSDVPTLPGVKGTQEVYNPGSSPLNPNQSSDDPRRARAQATVSKFDVMENAIHNNVSLDPKNFETK